MTFNDLFLCRFGGNGSVLNIHEHTSSDHTYNVTAGLMRDEAIDLFRQFYNGENQRGEPRTFFNCFIACVNNTTIVPIRYNTYYCFV